MYQIKETGGAQIGLTNCTKPFAILTADKDKLELNATIIGNLMFRPSDVSSITFCRRGLKGGIQIEHSVSNYPKKVIFLTSDAHHLINQIEQTGFLINRSPIPPDIDQEISDFQSSGRFPIKTSAAIILFVLWNILVLSSFYTILTSNQKVPSIGWGIPAALGLFILVPVLILTSEPFRDLVLKPGRKPEHVNRALYFIILICSAMLITFSFIPAISQTKS